MLHGLGARGGLLHMRRLEKHNTPVQHINLGWSWFGSKESKIFLVQPPWLVWLCRLSASLRDER